MPAKRQQYALGDATRHGSIAPIPDLPAVAPKRGGPDPKRSSGAFTRLAYQPQSTDRAMEAWYYPPHEYPQLGGSHGKQHRTTKILSRARLRSGRLAPRGASAAARAAAAL